MSEVELYKVYGGEMFKWYFDKDYDGDVFIKFQYVSELIPASDYMIFTASNDISFRRYEYASLSRNSSDDYEIDLPEEDFNDEINVINFEKEKIHKALLEFHEFCLKTYGSKSTETVKEEVKEEFIGTFKSKPESNVDINYHYHPYLRNISTEPETSSMESPEIVSEKLVKVLEVINTIVFNGLEVPEVFIEKFNQLVEDYNRVAKASC